MIMLISLVYVTHIKLQKMNNFKLVYQNQYLKIKFIYNILYNYFQKEHIYIYGILVVYQIKI